MNAGGGGGRDGESLREEDRGEEMQTAEKDVAPCLPLIAFTLHSILSFHL